MEILEEREIFLTTLPEVQGYEIVENMGFIMDESLMSGVERSIKDIKKLAMKMGCNAIVNLRVLSAGGSHGVVYGDGVVIRPKSDKVSETLESSEAIDLPEVPDFTNPDNLMNW